MFTLVGQLPRHHYVFIDSAFTHKQPQGFIPAVWFGLVSLHSRVWGCTVMLESGAIYRNLPPHALAFNAEPEAEWCESDAQRWDCYGEQFTTIEYKYLAELEVLASCGQGEDAQLVKGEYLFTAAPIGDGFSMYPDQAKEFTFAKLDNGRLTIQPTNNILFIEKSFTNNKDLSFPVGMKRQQEVYACE